MAGCVYINCSAWEPHDVDVNVRSPFDFLCGRRWQGLWAGGLHGGCAGGGARHDQLALRSPQLLAPVRQVVLQLLRRDHCFWVDMGWGIIFRQTRGAKLILF
jgi:hypothetical protein